MNDITPRPVEHLAIKAVCVVGLINASQMVHLALSPMTKQIGALFPFYFTFSIVVSLVCLVGLWFMKRWAALLYAILLACNQLALMLMGFWEITSIIIPCIILYLLFRHRSDMH